ncbi:MAG: aldehyde-activating protein [Alphaproteobacteria bacterium]|nr:aldehyde-activating protein [Alphaproteobacteria bacterium]
MEHSGGCHCGNMIVRLRLAQSPQDSPLRACGCRFCRAHSTRTVADQDGLFELWAADWLLVEPYRFGSRTAEYLVCRRCGVYVAAVGETAAGLRAVVNVNSLDDRAAFTRVPIAMDYEGETEAMRLARRAVNWMPARLHR